MVVAAQVRARLARVAPRVAPKGSMVADPQVAVFQEVEAQVGVTVVGARVVAGAVAAMAGEWVAGGRVAGGWVERRVAVAKAKALRVTVARAAGLVVARTVEEVGLLAVAIQVGQAVMVMVAKAEAYGAAVVAMVAKAGAYQEEVPPEAATAAGCLVAAMEAGVRADSTVAMRVAMRVVQAMMAV